MSTSKWLDEPLTSNRYIKTYFNGFVDISGGDLFLRGDDESALHCNLYVNNGDISLNGRLFVSNDVSLNSRLTVSKDVSLNSRLFVGGDVSINSRLFVGSDTIIFGRLSVNEYQDTFIINTTTTNYTLIIAEDISLNGNLYVLKDTSLNGRLFLGGDASLNSRLIVYSDVSFNSRLFVGGDVSLNSRLVVCSDTSLNGLLFVGNDTSMNGNLYVSKNVRIGTTDFIYGTSGQIFTLDLSGSSNFRGVVNPIRFIDDSVLFTNTPDFDFLNNFGMLWTKNTNSFNVIWTSIAMSSTGQYQLASSGSRNELNTNNNYNVNSGFLYLSNNYGVTWNKINLNKGPYLSVAVSSTGKYMIAVLNKNNLNNTFSSDTNNFLDTDNIYTSNDYGATWKASNKSYSVCYSTAISATGQYQVFIQNNVNGNLFFPTTSQGNDNNNIYISFDYGSTFNSYGNYNNMSGIAISATGQYITITQYYESAPTTTISGTPGYIYISSNFGLKWKKIVEANKNWNCIAMSSSGQYQYAGVHGGQIYFSDNYGASWKATNSINGNWTSISVTSDGKNVVACINGGGIYSSINYGNTWILTNASSTNKWKSICMSSNGKYITSCAGLYNDIPPFEYIYNSTTPFENISISNVLNVLNDTSLNNRLYVWGDSFLKNRLLVEGDVSLNNRLYVQMDVSLNSRLFVSSDVSLNSRLYVKNNICVGDTNKILNINTNNLLTLSSGTSGGKGATIQLYGAGSSNSTVNINFDTYYNKSKTNPASIIQAIDNGNLSNDLTFWTTSPGSISNNPQERMRITGNGNVGIGITNPNQVLDVSGYIRVSGPNTTGSDTVGIEFVRGSSSFGNDRYTDWKIYNSAGALRFLASDTVYSTNERMCILDNGNVGIGTTNPTTQLHVISSNGSGDPDTRGIYCYNPTPGDSTTKANGCVICVRTNGAYGGNPWYSLDSYAINGWSMGMDLGDSKKLKFTNNWNFSSLSTSTMLSIDRDGNGSFKGNVTAGSDYRIKTNINPIIDTVTTTVLNPVTYQRKDNSSNNIEYGFIAHEVQEHYPGLVTGYKDQVDSCGNIVMQTLNYSGIIPIAVNDIIRMDKEIKLLKEKNTELENRIALLEQRFGNL